jgi:hypothetical protein
MWQRIKNWFHDSETLAWARLQSVLGFAALALTYIDPSVLAPVIGDARWFPWLVLANGLATEFLRRRRASDLK